MSDSVSDNVLVTSRVLPFGKSETMAAWTDPTLLSQWWGPEGFTNEFEVCDVIEGGEWKFVMRGPDGTAYQNESRWLEIGTDHFVIEHVCSPWFVLRADFVEKAEGTDVVWTTTFEDPEFLPAMKDFLIEKNGENMDRLHRVLERMGKTPSA